MDHTRQCGDCAVCCITPSIHEKVVDKPACVVCPFLNHGCKIFNQPSRPQVCSEYYCTWMMGYGSEIDQPHHNNVMVSISTLNGGTWIFVLDLVKKAHLTTGKRMIVEVASKIDLPVIVFDYDHLTDGKGDYVIIKKSLESRSKQIMGELIDEFTDGMNIYKLIVR